MNSLSKIAKTQARGNVPAPKSKPKELKLNEAQVTKQILDFFALKGYRAERQNVGLADFGGRKVRFGNKAAPDYIFVHPWRRAFYVEIKAEGETIRPMAELASLLAKHPKNKAIKHEYEQAVYLAKLERAGFAAFWANSVAMAKGQWEGGVF